MKKPSLILAIDKLTLKALCLCALLSVFFFAILFFGLSNTGSGIRSPYGESSSFGNCLHFSVVTFTSLGYGDFYPVGWGKVVADVEVLGGLVFLGLLVAKLASARQNYYLAQLYARDAQTRLRDFYSALKRLRLRYKEASEISVADTPVSLKVLHKDAEVLVMNVRNYIAYEIANGDFLGEIPKGPMARVLESYAAIAPLISKVAIAQDSLSSQKQRGMAVRVLGWMNEVAVLVRDNSADISLLSEAKEAVLVTDREREATQRRFDEVAAKFPNVRMPRPIEWRLTKGHPDDKRPV